MNSKIVKIILILLFAGSSFLIGFLVGQTYSGMSNEVALNNQAIKDKETLLNEVEENLQKYIVMPEVPDQILGEILKIDKDKLFIEKTPTTTHDIVWGTKLEIEIFINDGTKIYTFETNHSETVKTNVLPDGTIIDMPPEEFVKKNLDLNELQKNQPVTVNYSMDGEKHIADEIILR
ncbi:hypothetical protein HN958_00880 [Candidatus Falkowbacteria bacterium]|jgi:hypothetical protein|nr:hypothetical protein [Candidatus Falkowbacteria bacterium]MBT7007045.1 hypothetical protein [Candidatus Falkowbacteria bacterium]